MTAVESTGFGALLRRLRLAAGLTQEALAERAGLSAKAVSDLERDPTRSPRLDSVALLADALALDPEGRTRLLKAARPDSASPAASALPAGPSRALPRPLTPLIGRAGEAAAVADVLRRRETQMCTLTGPGGVGKTRLAIEAAEHAADAFADGVVFIDLAPLRDAALVLPTVARRLGVDERDATPLAERLAAALRGKHLLLLLDNLEHLVAARGTVLSLVEACPSLVVLATSRVALRVRGEREHRVAPLDLPTEASTPESLAQSAAVVLFLERARAAGIELPLDAATTPAVAAICRRLDGLPLAIELAAAWARLLPPSALLARLERRLPLLVGGAHDLPARQRTMRDAIAWSYDLLDAPEQQLFRRLCVFAGGCTPEAAETVCADAGEEPAVLAGLAALVDKSLLRRDDGPPECVEPRLVMLETIREYGLERLEASGEAEASRRRHASLYLALAEAAEPELRGPNQLAWGARLEREHDNLRAALHWALDRGAGETASRLAAALWRFWAARGHLSEGRRWLQAALALPAAGDEGAPTARAAALAGAAMLAIEQGAYAEATPLCADAATLARELGARRELVVALNAQGMLARDRGDYAEAARRHEEALALAEPVGDRAGSAAALTGLAYVASFTGDVARAIALGEQSLTILRTLGDAHGLTEALVAASAVCVFAGAYERAEALGGEALTLGRAQGDTGQMVGALWTLGIVALLRERHQRAAALHEESLALLRERGDEHGAVQPLGALALVALREGDHQRARRLLEEALAILHRYNDPWGQAMSLLLLGHVELAAGDAGRAHALLSEGTALHQAIGNPLYLPWCLEGLAGVAAARGQWERAARLCGARDALLAQVGPSLPPAHPVGYAGTLADTRAALGDDVFAAAHENGMALPLERALAEAAAIMAGAAGP